MGDCKQRQSRSEGEREVTRRAVVGDDAPGRDPAAVVVRVDRAVGFFDPGPKREATVTRVHDCVGRDRDQCGRQCDRHKRGTEGGEDNGEHRDHGPIHREVERLAVVGVGVEVGEEAGDVADDHRDRRVLRCDGEQ